MLPSLILNQTFFPKAEKLIATNDQVVMYLNVNMFRGFLNRLGQSDVRF